MPTDRYMRALLTVIAGALLYICAVLTPVPALSAQRGNRPGDDTGPARVVIVGWQAPEGQLAFPVQVLSSVPVRINGTVETEPRANSINRVVLAGWEENGTQPASGVFNPLRREGRLPGLPVTTVPLPNSTR